VQRAYFPTSSTSNIEEENWVSISSTIVQNELTVFSKKENGTILIFDLAGKLILKNPLSSEVNFDLENLMNGGYVLQVRTEKSIKVFRIIKQ